MSGPDPASYQSAAISPAGPVPGASPDPVRELARKLTTLSFTRLVLVTLSLVAIFLFSQLTPLSDRTEIASWQFGLISVVYALTIVYAVLLGRRLAIRALAYAQVVLDTFIAATLVSMTGGIDSPFTFVYVFTVIGASMTLSRRGAVVAWISFFLTLGAVLVLQLDLLLPPTVNVVRAVFSFLMYSVGIALVGVLASALAQKIEVTGRRLAETQGDYEKLTELYAAILRSLPGGLMTVDAEGIVRYANETALAILRSTSLDIIGTPLAAVAQAMAPEWQRFQAHQDREAERERFEATFERSDGRQIRLGFSFARLGKEAGLGSGSIVVFQDVTEFVRLKEAYERAERLASVGKIAAGLAHEVRNPLASMCASIDVMKQALSPPEPMKRLMTNVVKEADRLNALITDFLAFARPREPQRRRTDVSAVVAGVVDVFKNDKLLSSVKLEQDLDPNVYAWIDPDQMRQVVWNLARNAAEAMARVPEATLTIHTTVRGTTAEIHIADTGPGIPPEQTKRIFDPFYTTKEGGSGLGLAIVHAIVQAHGGRILVESRPERGTEVTIALPTEATVDTPLVRADLPEPTIPSPVTSGPSDLDLLSSSGPHVRNLDRGA